MEEFEKYLEKKKIDSTLFKKQEPDLWANFIDLFSQVHPNSFTAQKLFLINQIRRKYPLMDKEQQTKEPAQKAVKTMRPISMAKPKIVSQQEEKPKSNPSRPVIKRPIMAKIKKSENNDRNSDQ